MGEMDRREFLKSSGAAAAATALATPVIAKGVRGANERIRVGVEINQREDLSAA